MISIRKFGLLLTLLLFSNVAAAARVWLFEDVLIESVTIREISGTTATQIVISDSTGTQSYSCAPTQQARVVSQWAGGTNDFIRIIHSTAIAAHAQGLRVDVMVETNTCSTNSNWGNGPGMPAGHGLDLKGIRIRSD
ncbi:MAG: hypothetical protein ACK4SX_00985 [Alcanivoracaceae bacterium]